MWKTSSRSTTRRSKRFTPTGRRAMTTAPSSTTGTTTVCRIAHRRPCTGARIVPVGHRPTRRRNGRKPSPHADRRRPDDSRIMQEEIFGPLLPIRTYAAFDEAIDVINAGSRSLALYYFGPCGPCRTGCWRAPPPATSASTPPCCILPVTIYRSAASAPAAWGPITALKDSGAEPRQGRLHPKPLALHRSAARTVRQAGGRGAQGDAAAPIRRRAGYQ